MSLYFKGEPVSNTLFRENTAKHAKMAGVQFSGFKCRACGKNKPLEGSKRISKHLRDGYRCADCAALSQSNDQ